MVLLARLRWVGSYLIEQLKFADDSPIEMRSRFKLRLLVMAVVLPLPPLLLFAATELHLIGRDVGKTIDQWIPFVDLGFGLILAPAFLFRSTAKPPPPPDDDDDWNRWKDPPPDPRTPPGGGLPLRDSKQSRSRFRDHSGPWTSRIGARRRGRDPARSPLTPGRR